MSKPAKRNSSPGIDQPVPSAQGVGGRQGARPQGREGGRYPDICTVTPIGAQDPRVAEFRRAGLPQLWISAAEIIGYDRFMALWELLTEADEYHDNAGRVRLPSMGLYYRHLRNEWIRSLLDDGFEPREIQRAMRTKMGHTLSISSIQRIGNDRR